MTKRELWLRLFSESDVALASAIHFCERFVTSESLEYGSEFISEKVKELNNIIPQKDVELIFGNKE